MEIRNFTTIAKEKKKGADKKRFKMTSVQQRWSSVHLRQVAKTWTCPEYQRSPSSPSPNWGLSRGHAVESGLHSCVCRGTYVHNGSWDCFRINKNPLNMQRQIVFRFTLNVNLISWCIRAPWFDKVTFGAFWHGKSRHFTLVARWPLKGPHLLPSITFHISPIFWQRCALPRSSGLNKVSFQLTFSSGAADNAYPEC